MSKKKLKEVTGSCGVTEDGVFVDLVVSSTHIYFIEYGYTDKKIRIGAIEIHYAIKVQENKYYECIVPPE